MATVRVQDITEYVDRSNPALPVPRVLVTALAQDGRPFSFAMDRTQAADRPAITRAVELQAAQRLRLAPPIVVLYADHLQPSPAGGR